MPKRNGVRKSNDHLARRLFYKSAGENGEAVRLQPENGTIDSQKPISRNDNTEVYYTQDSFANHPGDVNYPGYEETSDYYHVFPLIAYLILALIAVLFVIEICMQKLMMPLTEYVYPILMSLVLGVACTVLSWMVTFSDSLHPGSHPPSPISPQKLRKHSGHTFHSSYAICLANGFITFLVSLWYLVS